MAVLEKRKLDRPVFDDAMPLACTIEASRNLKDHTVYILRVQRGPVPDNTWNVEKRFSDFVALDSCLHMSGIELLLPPKRVFGNMDREFVAERQQKLQSYIQTVLSHPYLANSVIVKRFLDFGNYNTNLQEVALQNISMFFRSEVKWEVIEPISDIGTRLRKQYFLIREKANPKSRYLLSWCTFGPDKFLPDKDLVNIMKLLQSFQHKYIFPVAFAMANETGGICIRSFQHIGSVRDIMCKTKPKLHYLKKYAAPKEVAVCQPPAIKIMCRQILETLKFLHDKGLPYGHLHAGNIILEGESVKLLDLENWLLGIPAYYRCYFTQLKKVNTMEDIDVYSFGHLLYELVTGKPLDSPTCDQLPSICSPEVRSVLESILSTEACKNGLPTIADLLQHQLFQDVVLPSSEKPQFKIPSKLKDAIREAKLGVEKRLKDEQKVIKQFRRLSKAKAFHMSEDEKKKRRKSKKKQIGTDAEAANGDIPRKAVTNPTAAAPPNAPAPPPVQAPPAPAPPAPAPPPLGET